MARTAGNCEVLDNHRDTCFGVSRHIEDQMNKGQNHSDCNGLGPLEPKAQYAVIGLGKTGTSVVRFLTERGISPLVFDTREKPPQRNLFEQRFPGVRIKTGPIKTADIKRCDKLVVSPGVDPNLPAISAARASGSEVIGDIECFARQVEAPVIAITGTNGKSTVTTLVAEILQRHGFRVAVGGNLGTPALDLLQNHLAEVFVLELSSFQLATTNSLSPDVACILNIAPDHLDRHSTFGEYVATKSKILSSARSVVVNADDCHSRDLPSSAVRYRFSIEDREGVEFFVREQGKTVSLFDPQGKLLDEVDLGQRGSHNIANALAAAAISTLAGASRDSIIAILREFKGLPHRSEFVASIKGVDFVNDSKATNPHAASASIRNILKNKTGVVILGGRSKHTDFKQLAKTLISFSHTIVLIGEAKEEIESALGGRVKTLRAADMNEAVSLAAGAAKKGDAVLLAPACTSLDQYSDYQARGYSFSRAVRELSS